MADPGIFRAKILSEGPLTSLSYAGVPVFHGGTSSDCEEFIRAVYAYAFEKDKAEDDKWIAIYAASRLSGQALRWYARQDKAVKLDWSALQVALLDQYPPSDDDGRKEDVAIESTAQPLPTNVPTPAAAAASPAGALTNSRMASIFPWVKQITVSGCKKARIRVETENGTVKGWISSI
ncbi:hypothetical protein FS837_007523 [Tulasnella sp. UAMH 9824]|nr:hypothetical protein FS837_007523 [Tulasnella sp. UAMH 9824]